MKPYTLYLISFLFFLLFLNYSCKKNDSPVTIPAPCSPADNSYSGTNGIGDGAFASVSGNGIGNTYFIEGVDNYTSVHFTFSGNSAPAAGIYTTNDQLVLDTAHDLVGVSFQVDPGNVYFALGFQKVYVNVSGSSVTITTCDLIMVPSNGSDSTMISCKVIKQL